MLVHLTSSQIQRHLGAGFSPSQNDAIGNPLNYRSGMSMTWQSGRELQSLTRTNSSSSYDKWEYTYDVNGQRTSKTQKYATSASGTWSTVQTTKFYYDGTKLAAEKKGGTIVWYDYDETGSPIGMRVNGQDYFFQRNAQGDVTGIYDPNGELIVTYTYDSWGKLTEVGGAYSHTIGEYNSLRYRGYYYDADTGLYYANSRYYDPETHRFVNSDTYTSTGQGILGNNMFAYCDYDPINRIDTDGEFWDTIFDVVSLGVSIADVIANPDDPWAWAGLAADVVSLAVPLVSGGGAVVKAVTKADDVADGLKAINMADNAKRGWNVGDDITNLTKAGNEPKWSTVRQRYWKNEAFFNPQQYSDKDLALMKKGRAPLVQSNGKFYPMELHHIEPRHLGGSNAYKILMPVTPWMHAQIDRHRFFVP